MSDPILPSPAEAIVDGPAKDAPEPAHVASEPAKAPAGPPKAPGATPIAAPKSQTSNGKPAAADGDGGMSREVRLGLVLYGGVSLAVYMNGVAHEFFNAVRGRGIYALIKALTDSDVIVDIISGASAGGINGIFLGFALCNEKEFGDFAQLWRNQGDVDLLLRKPGGAPESYLSLFDCEHYYQDRLHDAFRVVRDIDQQNVFEMPSGVLDGAAPGGTESSAERPHVKELDLYITGTNVGGNIYTEVDDAGHAITVKDHRSVFILSHRRGRKAPFAPKDHPDVTFESLAKLSRITSAFPAAFSPVKVEDVAPDIVTVDGKLQRWGQIGVKAYFVDGGVLYNKPFSYTIQGIVYRLANIETERFLLYVEPDPERFEEVLKDQQAGLAEAPNFFTDISDSLISLPGYQSIAGDLQDLTEQNSKVRRYQVLTETLQACVWDKAEREKYPRDRSQERPPESTSPDLEDLSGPAQEIHQRSRLLGLGERVIQGALRTQVGRNLSLTPVQARAAEALTCALFVHLQDQKDQRTVLDNTDVYYRLRRTFHASSLIRTLLYKERSIKPESDEGRRYLKLRYTLNRQIDLLQIVQTVMEELVDTYPIIEWGQIHRADQIGPKEAAEALGLVNSLLQHLLNTQGALPVAGEDHLKYRQFLDGYLQAWGPGWEQKSLEALEQEWLPQAALTDVINGLRGIRNFLKEKSEAVVEPRPFMSLLSVIDDCTARAFAALTGTDDRVHIAYKNFDLLDSVLYPIELAGDLQCKDVIKTVRVSPFDAQRGFSCKDLDKKVAGIGFHHFAAFFKRSWRSNDIMWGRLDGLCQLTECLLKRDRLDQVLLVRDSEGHVTDSIPEALERIQRRFGMFDAQNNFTGCIPQFDPGAPGQLFALHPDALFPNNSPESRNSLTAWLQALLSSNVQTRCDAINELPLLASGGPRDAQQTGPLELLIQLAQYEVIREVLPQVAQDAAEEQLEWNCYPVTESQRAKVRARGKKPLKLDLKSVTFKEGTSKLEPTEVSIAAAAAATLGLAAIEGDRPPAGKTPKQTPLGRFFDQSFGLKTTNLGDSLPPSILVSIVVQAMRVFSSCALTALGDTGQNIEKNAAFRHIIDWPLKVAYTWSQWWRRSPASERSWRVTLWWTAVALLVIGILARQQLIFPNQSLSLPWFIALLIVPLAVLLTLYFAGMRRRWTVIVLLAAVAGISAGIVIGMVQWLRQHGHSGLAAWQYTDSAIMLALLLALAAALGAHWGRRRPEPLRIVTPDVLKRGAVGQHYVQELMATGGEPPYHWTVVNGDGLLSSVGLTLTVSGMINGFPQKHGNYVLGLRASDSRSKKTEQRFQIAIAAGRPEVVSSSATATPTAGASSERTARPQ